MIDQGNRFRQHNRLLKASEYQDIFKKPIRVVDQNFTILAKANQLNTARLGLAISKKNLKFAVDRNRIKRIARESFRIHMTDLSGIDLIVMAKRGVSEVDNKLLFSSLSKLWKNLHLKL